MVAYATNELIPSSQFAKRFGSYLTQIKDNTVSKLAILKNNKVEAVLISKDEYEMMSEALKKVQANEFINSINNGLNDVQKGNTKCITKLWDEIDD
jgi:PHD/YefM family antitoxin component YafN of YafNO toxin-antitoxin module